MIEVPLAAGGDAAAHLRDRRVQLPVARGLGKAFAAGSLPGRFAMGANCQVTTTTMRSRPTTPMADERRMRGAHPLRARRDANTGPNKNGSHTTPTGCRPPPEDVVIHPWTWPKNRSAATATEINVPCRR